MKPLKCYIRGCYPREWAPTVCVTCKSPWWPGAGWITRAKALEPPRLTDPERSAMREAIATARESGGACLAMWAAVAGAVLFVSAVIALYPWLPSWPWVEWLPGAGR